MTDTSPIIAEARAIANRVEEFLEKVEVERYGRRVIPTWPEPFVVTDFVNNYIDGESYPLDRLVECTLRAVDVRLQCAYIYTNLGLENVLYHGAIHDQPDLARSARLQLILMTLTQSLIGSIRIGWEKLIRLVHHLESGQQEIAGKSIKGAFFKWLRTQEKWRFLEPYERIIEEFDTKYRTGEFHKHSVVRGVLIKGADIDTNELLKPYNYLYGVIWPNLIEILHGKHSAVGRFDWLAVDLGVCWLWTDGWCRSLILGWLRRRRCLAMS